MSTKVWQQETLVKQPAERWGYVGHPKARERGGQSKAGENQTEENKHPTKPSHNKLLPLERALQTTLKRPERNMYAAAHINGTSK